MRFKEFFNEDQFQQQPLQPGNSLFTIPGGSTIQIPTTIRQKYDDKTILDLLKKQGYPVPSATTGTATPSQGASTTPAASQVPAQAETPPPGYRFLTLPNGNLTAVPQHLDDTQALDLIKRRRPDLLSANVSLKSSSHKKPARVIIPSDLPALPDVDPKLVASAKRSADAYLGRTLTPEEWDHLLRATFAESGHNEKEDAHIMATILNRARMGAFGGTNISNVLGSPGEFQAVTGTVNKPGMHTNFTQGPPKENLTTILNSAIKYLPKIPKDIGYFTSNKEAAYQAGTNKEFLKRLKASGGHLVGDTVFTKMDSQGHIVKVKPTTLAKK